MREGGLSLGNAHGGGKAEEKRRKKGLARCNNALIEKQPVSRVQPRLPADPQLIAASNRFAMTSLPSDAFT